LSNPEQPRLQRHLSGIQVLGIISTVVAIAMIVFSVWQTASVRHLDSQLKQQESLATKIDAVKDALADFKIVVTDAISHDATRIDSLEKRFDIHESNERRFEARSTR